MNGLYFYKLLSPYKEDVTKDCKLTINEIDHNFITLKNSDIKDGLYDSDNGTIKLIKNNGDEINIDISELLTSVVRDLSVDFDKESGIITILYDDKEVVINDLLTTQNMSNYVLTEVSSDNTIVGLGTKESPLGVSPMEKTGFYKSAKKFINLSKGEALPPISELEKGDRFLTLEEVDDFGLLYDYETVLKINESLSNGWRIPTKEDWDNVLNAIEPCDEYRNHTSPLANQVLGKYAGKLLKSKDFWCESNITLNEGETSRFGLRKKEVEPTGTDEYGMHILPCGAYTSDLHEEYYDFLIGGYYWSTTRCNASDVYVKRFDYDKSGVYQSMESPKSYFSIRLVKDYNEGDVVSQSEYINGYLYETVMLPSNDAKSKHSIWTRQNVYFVDVNYNYVKPNGDYTLPKEKIYYINEWDGEKWLKKEFSDGDKIVLHHGLDGLTYREYTLIAGELVQDYEKIEKDIRKIIGSGITDSEGNIITLTDAIVDEIKDRKDTTDSLYSLIETETVRASNAEIELEENLTSEIIDDEETISSAISDIASYSGLLLDDGEISYVKKENAAYISSATTIHEATVILDDELKNVNDILDVYDCGEY